MFKCCLGESHMLERGLFHILIGREGLFSSAWVGAQLPFIYF